LAAGLQAGEEARLKRFLCGFGRGAKIAKIRIITPWPCRSKNNMLKKAKNKLNNKNKYIIILIMK
jgi:hypothetical protein